METALCSINEAASYLGVGRSYLYARLVATGELPVVRLGRAVRIPRRALEQYVERLHADAIDAMAPSGR